MVMLMALVMTVTYMPAAAFAEPIPEQNAAQTDTQTEAFAREANIDDVIISATIDQSTQFAVANGQRLFKKVGWTVILQ
jgi:hypothetical protein